MGTIDTEDPGEEASEGYGEDVVVNIMAPETNMVTLYRHRMLSVRFLQEL